MTTSLPAGVVLTTLTPHDIQSPQTTRAFTPGNTTPDSWFTVGGLPYWVDGLMPVNPMELHNKMKIDLTTYLDLNTAALITTPKYQPWSAAEKATIWKNIKNISDTIDVTFTDTSGQHDNSVSDSTIYIERDTSLAIGGGITQASSDFQPAYITGGPIYNFNRVILMAAHNEDNLIVNERIITHEMGHVLGLTHPFEGFMLLSASEDIGINTTMSYTGPFGKGLQNLDTAALQYLYGPSKVTRTGNDTYHLDPNTANFIWDGVGTNTIDASDLQTSVDFSLAPGYWGFMGASRASGITAPGQITVNYHSLMQNAIGTSQADRITGNDQNNQISGGAGNDILGGNEGNDTINGGTGTDTALFNHPASHYTITRLSNGHVSIKDYTVSQPNPVLYTDLLIDPSDTSAVMGANLHMNGLYTGEGSGNYLAMTRAANLSIAYGDVVANPISHTRPIMSDDTDELIGVERIAFSDKKIAIDFAPGQAGEQAARLIGSAAGKSFLSDKELVGVALNLYDSGSTTADIAHSLVVNNTLSALAGGNDDTHMLAFIYKNVVGRNATAAEMAELLPLVHDQGQAWLITAAASLDLTADQINLVGLAQTGLEFV